MGADFSSPLASSVAVSTTDVARPVTVTAVATNTEDATYVVTQYSVLVSRETVSKSFLPHAPER